MDKLPNKRDLMESILYTLKENGGKLPTTEINKQVALHLQIPPELLEIEDINCTGSEFSYRMRWARTELKQLGLIENIKRGEWCLVEK